MKNTNHLATVEEAFRENKFWAFRAFCMRKSITYISELTLEQVEEHAKRKNTKPNTVLLIKQRLNNLLNLKTEKIIIYEDFEMENARRFLKDNRIKEHEQAGPIKTSSKNNGQPNGIFKDNKDEPRNQKNKRETAFSLIEQVFSENLYLTFRRYCKSKKIKTVFEINNHHLNEYAGMRGVGASKVNGVKNRMEEYLTGSENTFKLTEEDKPETIMISLEAGFEEINNIFSDSKFTKFKMFCARRGIKVFGEITNKHLEEFGNVKQVGKKKVEEVRQMLNAYSKTSNSEATYFTTGAYYEFLKEQTVQTVLLFYGIENNSTSTLKIKDIEGKNMNESLKEFSPSHLLALTNHLKKQKNPKEIITNLLAKFTDRELEILQFRYGESETLEQVGTRLDVTRERVRQISKKIIKLISTHLKSDRFATIVRVMVNFGQFATKKELLNLVGTKYEAIINLLAHENILFKYFKKIDIYFFDDEKKIDFAAIEEFIKELPDVFILSDYGQPIKEVLYSNGIENPSLEMIQSILMSEKYKNYGKYYSKHNFTMSEVLMYLFKNDIQEPLRIDDAGIRYLQELAWNHFKFNLVSSVQSIENRLRDLESIILVDRATFSFFDKTKFDTNVMLEIEDYLFQEFRIREIINVEELFINFQQPLQDAGVKNKIHLYSLVKFFLQGKFIIGQGNTLNIYKSEESIISNEKQLIRFMKQHGGLCSKKQLLEVIQPLYRIEQAVSVSEKIIPWGSEYILFENLEITSADKNLLKELLNMNFDKGYSTVSLIYNEMLANNRLSTLLRKMKIDHYSKLTGVIKVIIPQIKASGNFLYIEGHEIDSFEKVIYSKFTGKTSRKELKEFSLEHGYSDRNAININKRLLDKGIFIEIGLDELYPVERFKISQFDFSYVYEFVEKEMGRKDYISLSKLNGYEDKLPELDFPWNAFLLKSILELSGYRQVKKIISDYRFDKIIIVRESSSIWSFEELVLHLLKNEYTGNFHENDIYDFLVEKGIVNLQEYENQKVLPAEIKTSSSFNKELQKLKRTI